MGVCLKFLMQSSDPDLHLICQGGILKTWKSVLTIFSPHLAEILLDVCQRQEAVFVSVLEDFEVVKELFMFIIGTGEVVEIGDCAKKVARDIGIDINLRATHQKNSREQNHKEKQNIENERESETIIEKETNFEESSGIVKKDGFPVPREMYLNENLKLTMVSVKNEEGLAVREKLIGLDFVQKTADIPVPNKKRIFTLKSSEKKKLGNFFCTLCKGEHVSFITKTSFNRHLVKFHEATVNCEECGESFDDKSLFERHINSLCVPCEFCPTKFQSIKRMKVHKEQVHGNSEKHPCSVCGISIKNVKKHMRVMHADSRELTKCPSPNCTYAHKQLCEVEKHFSRIHTEAEIKTCNFCGKITKSLKRHLKNKQCDKITKVKNSFVCEICSKMFSQLSGLKQHKKSIHEKIKDKQCPECGYCTYSNFNLKLHVNNVHLGKKLSKEPCHICGQPCYNVEYHVKLYHAES